MRLRAKECQQPPETGEARKDPPLDASETAWPCQHLDSDLCPPELGGDIFLTF